jgi:hypothetical protein
MHRCIIVYEPASACRRRPQRSTTAAGSVLPRTSLFLLLILCLALPSRALLGIGAHAGLDLSVGMDEGPESVAFTGKSLVAWGDSVLDSSIAYTLNRTGWRRTPVNFGGKFYVDVIPVIDAVELSFNFGIWEYQCSLTYPAMVAGALTTKTRTVSLDSLRMKQKWGVGDVPYAKLHLDLTVRKYVLQVPRRLHLLNLYAGGGFSLIMSTPVIGPELARETLGSQLTRDTYEPNDAMLDGEWAVRNMLTRVTEGLTQVQGGMHALAGACFQLPVVPLSLYADARLMLPFGQIGEDAGLGGFGFVLNAGVALSMAGVRQTRMDGFQ